jgi:hypothetical protein
MDQSLGNWNRRIINVEVIFLLTTTSDVSDGLEQHLLLTLAQFNRSHVRYKRRNIYHEESELT